MHVRKAEIKLNTANVRGHQQHLYTKKMLKTGARM